MDYFAKRIRMLSKAHHTTLPLGQLQQLAHMTGHILKGIKKWIILQNVSFPVSM